MKKNIFFAIFLFSFSFSTSAQQWQWAFNEDGTSGIDIETDHSGNVYVLSSSNNGMYGIYPLPCGPAEAVIAKHDAFGNVMWARGLGLNSFGTSFCLDKAGNIYITGALQLTTTFCGGNNANITTAVQGPQQSDAFICKYNNNGDLQWIKTWGTNYANEGGSALKTDLNGNSYLTGRGNFWNYNLGEPQYNFFLLKYDAQGALLWEKTSNWKGDIYAADMDLDNNGNSYIAGYFSDSAFFDNITLNANAENHTIFIVKYNRDGNAIWAKKDGTGYDECHGITLDKTGSFYITGACSPLSTFGNTTLPLGGMLIAKYDTSGINIWAKRGGGGLGYSIDSDTSGGCVITGFYDGTQIFGSGTNSTTLTSPKTRDIFLAKFNKSGILYWAIAPTGSTGDENMSFAVSCDFANNYYITGRFCRTTIFGNSILVGPTAPSNFNIFVAKIKDTSRILTDVKPVFPSQNELKIFPNPTLSSIHIIYKSFDEINNLGIIIRNVTGQEIYSKTYKKTEGDFNNNGGSTTLTTSINVEKYARGVYLIEVDADGQRSVKMIILN